MGIKALGDMSRSKKELPDSFSQHASHGKLRDASDLDAVKPNALKTISKDAATLFRFEILRQASKLSIGDKELSVCVRFLLSIFLQQMFIKF